MLVTPTQTPDTPVYGKKRAFCGIPKQKSRLKLTSTLLSNALIADGRPHIRTAVFQSFRQEFDVIQADIVDNLHNRSATIQGADIPQNRH